MYQVRKTAIATALLLVLCSCGSGPRAPLATQAPELISEPRDFGFALQKLAARGASPAFLSELEKAADLTTRDDVIDRNVFGYEVKPDYLPLIGEEAVRNCVSFIQAQRAVLRAAERRFGVPESVIAALLWIETKHGAVTGKHGVASVFLNLAMADHPGPLERSLEKVKREMGPDDPDRSKMNSKIHARSRDKAEWAVNQLLALEKMRDAHVDILALKGSYAGAFGIPQFIPTTYLELAVASRKRSPANLFDPADAILSAANFLHRNGWGKRARAQRHALKMYNSSDDYVAAILSLATRVKDAEKARREG